MTVDIFDELLEIISPYLQKTNYREFLTPEFRLAFTICYLASGNSLPSMANYWQIGKSTAYDVVQETCQAISNTIGSLPDSSVFSATEFGQAVENDTLNAPPPSPLPGTNIMMPYFLVGDEIFPLRHNLMRPYSRRNPLTETQRIFNYRLSRARRIIENAFGILSARWRILQTSLAQLPHSVENIMQQ
ncbi:PREDICTED: uncharacterized protein LOC108776241 [Cyphomyrmex costatus]|uniref:uncharacterized protein LOC108776241 n=1 Tax=Cyphomyrmex costatus TaxID=456900 RepID=UPI0008523941|nr:PREDICTED: uncharacterized protein LOC108776241 [Cyphomyrmex costatus]